MAYATIANGGVCYYPRLVDRVLKQDGSPVLDEKGNVIGILTATGSEDEGFAHAMERFVLGKGAAAR